jgi:hypothetical protein
LAETVGSWLQGQALRVLRNIDTAGRGRSIDRAGSGGMPPSCPTKAIKRNPFVYLTNQALPFFGSILFCRMAAYLKTVSVAGRLLPYAMRVIIILYN